MPYYSAKGVTLHEGDCRHLLPLIGDAAAIVTDPPYGLSFKIATRRLRDSK